MIIFIVYITLDINECSQNICHHQCTNTNGSYYCSCDTSTVLATNGIHCLGILNRIYFILFFMSRMIT